MRFRKEKGFTLIEIFIVITVIAVMAALVLPRFLSQPCRAGAAEAVHIMSAIRRGVITYYDARQTWPTLANQAAIQNTLGISYTAPTQGWSFRVDPFPNAAAPTDALITGTHANGTITLNVLSGGWYGTDQYDPDGGPCWPNLVDKQAPGYVP